MKVYNHSKQQFEKATKSECPRCKGFGGTSEDNREQLVRCSFCKGRGVLWKSATGWLRALNHKHSFLY